MKTILGYQSNVLVCLAMMKVCGGFSVCVGFQEVAVFVHVQTDKVSRQCALLCLRVSVICLAY